MPQLTIISGESDKMQTKPLMQLHNDAHLIKFDKFNFFNLTE